MNGPSPELRQAFADRLRADMTRRRQTIASLAAMTGISEASVASYRMARAFPSPTFVAALADALDSRELREAGTWRVRCPVDGRVFEATSRGGHDKQYCSAICSRKRRYRTRTGSKGTKAVKAKVYRVNRTLIRENGELRDTLRAHCWDCTVEWSLPGICPVLETCRWVPFTEMRKPNKPNAFKKAKAA